MEVVRKIIDSDILEQFIDLPKSMHNKKVEIIILPFVEIEANKKQISMKGFLKDYANPELINQEKNAWESAVIEKYNTL